MIGGPGSYMFGEEERRELAEVIESGYLFRYGSESDSRFKHKCVDFEREFAALLGTRHVLATTSGTASLLTALAALGIGAGDEVIVPGYTFIASISAVILSNATPVLAEIDTSLTLDPTKLEALITPRTRAIIPVHMLGNPCDMEPIMELAQRHKIFVLEDCCQAVGGSYRGRRLGTFGDIGVFSLNLFKVISAGDGGVVCTDDDNLYERAFAYHDQGHKPLRYGVEVGRRSMVGMNFRMNELTGAVALAQTRKLDAMLARLRRNKSRIKNGLLDLPYLSFRKINDEDGECATILTLLFDTRERAAAFCAAIGTVSVARSGWHVYNNMEQIIRHTLPAEREGGESQIRPNMLPNTDDILERAVNISVGVVDSGLGAAHGINIFSTDDEIAAEINQLRNVISTLD